MTDLYFGGIEGGATHSKAVICDRNGTILSNVTGPGTNHWALGIPEVASRISVMIAEAKTQANLSQCIKLQSLGLSLSGCEQEATNKNLKDLLLEKYPNVAAAYFVCSDTVGSIFTASPLGGMVLIAGTGSNALLRNPDGKTYTCGGWGCYLADEGAAWWIAQRAIKICFDHEDKLILSPYDTSAVWEQIQTHFKIETRHDLLDHCYAKFDKAHFASICVHFAELAEKGDALSIHLFKEAGRYLAKATIALLPNVHKDLLNNGNLNIVCVGSVWKSWRWLKAGYSKEISSFTCSFGLNLITLTQPMAIGAVYVAADFIKYDLPRDYSHNYEIFHHIPAHVEGKNKLNGTNGVHLNVSNGLANGKKCNGTKINGEHLTNSTPNHVNGITNGDNDHSR